MALPAIIGTVARIGAAEAGGAAGGATAGRVVAQLGQVQGALSQIGNAANHSSDMIGRLVGSITGKLGKAMTLWIGWVESAARPIEELVRVANPAHADAFVRAFRDALGVVGRQLVPVMDAFTRIARKVGDVMAGLEPIFRPVWKAIAQLVDTIGTELAKTIKENTPFFEFLAAVITKVAEAASFAVKMIGEAIRSFNGIGRFVLRQFGFDGSSFKEGASSVGAAARQARFVQAKEISNDAIKNSLMMGIGANTPEQNQKRTADATEGILKWIERNLTGVLGGKGGEKGGGSVAGKVAAGLADLSPAVRIARWAMSQAMKR